MKLKLGKIPNMGNVRITISLPAILKSQLDRYAELHSQTCEQEVDATAFVPHIIAQFLAHDRAFKKKAERTAESKSGDS
jgi:hypothetical protein